MNHCCTRMQIPPLPEFQQNHVSEANQTVRSLSNSTINIGGRCAVGMTAPAVRNKSRSIWGSLTPCLRQISNRRTSNKDHSHILHMLSDVLIRPRIVDMSRTKLTVKNIHVPAETGYFPNNLPFLGLILRRKNTKVGLETCTVGGALLYLTLSSATCHQDRRNGLTHSRHERMGSP